MSCPWLYYSLLFFNYKKVIFNLNYFKFKIKGIYHEIFSINKKKIVVVIDKCNKLYIYL